MSDLSNVGHDKEHNDATEKYDAEHGSYKDPVKSVPEAERLPLRPQGPDPSPFKLGPITPEEHSE